MSRLIEAGCDRLLVLPLYPQYAAATTATVADVVFADLARRRYQPAMRIAAPYYDAPAYIEALATSLRNFLAGLNFAPDVILASFHGIPQEYADQRRSLSAPLRSDFHLLEKALGRPAGTMRMTYQSRFGPSEWLQPYTDETLMNWRAKASKISSPSRPDFQPIASRRWRKWVSRTGICFSKMAARIMPSFPA